MIHSLPNEALSQILSNLSLKSLITVRGVDQRWRALAQLCPLSPVRKALLDLYFDDICKTEFLETRDVVASDLQSFDRQIYVEKLETELGGTLAAGTLHCGEIVQRLIQKVSEFRSWILEWPSGAVFGYTWPGLPSKTGSWNNAIPTPPGRPFGRNCLSFPPKLQKLLYFGPELVETDSAIIVLALELWEHGCGWSSFLILQADGLERVHEGEVWCMEGHFMDGWGSEGCGGLESESWIAWLRNKAELRGRRGWTETGGKC